jgi:hypothetical protein
MTQETLTHSEDLLTRNVLTDEQMDAGYYLTEDDHNIFVMLHGERRAVLGMMTTSVIVRRIVEKLMGD